MLRILIPTDLHRDSRSGMRFAIQWAAQQKAKLLFFHVAYIPGLARHDKQYQAHRMSELDLRQRRLQQLVNGVFARMGIRDQPFECLVVEGISPETTLQDYCRKHKEINFVCMSTHGASGLQKWWGTHAGNLITQSSTPVVVVPKGYRARPLTHLVYATDLRHYQEELKKVAPLVHQLHAGLHVLHFLGPDEMMPDKHVFESVLQQEFHIECQLHFEHMDETRSMVANLDTFLHQMKPSLAILFTDQHRTLFEKIFFPSKAENLSFRTRTPLLVFPSHSTRNGS